MSNPDIKSQHSQENVGGLLTMFTVFPTSIPTALPTFRQVALLSEMPREMPSRG